MYRLLFFIVIYTKNEKKKDNKIWSFQVGLWTPISEQFVYKIWTIWEKSDVGLIDDDERMNLSNNKQPVTKSKLTCKLTLKSSEVEVL
mgnify:CR=1 FL=1